MLAMDVGGAASAAFMCQVSHRGGKLSTYISISLDRDKFATAYH
jgi:hypothetical protein